MNYFEHWSAMHESSFWFGFWFPPLVILLTHVYYKLKYRSK